LDLRAYDLVVSSSIAFTHAAQTRPDALHVSYVYTPMRYAWNLDAYLEHSSWSLPARVGARTVRPALRRWDRGTAGRPDLLVAISGTVQQRIARFWGRESEVLYPPVEVGAIDPTGTDDGFYLVAARMLAYRRLDDAIAACTRLGRDLVVVGEGPERARLQALAGPTVRFPGRVDRPTLLDFFGRCHAYLVPGEEDFGIAAIEAMAAGKPVVGLRAGGVAETVIDGATGVLYDDPGGPGMANAIERLESLVLDPAAIRRRAERFDVHVFRDGWRDLLARAGIDPPLYSPA
jgi:glycosyltransferase involved in cell wall biosynthesis